MLKIAVCSKDFTHVTGHAGQAKHWLLFAREDEADWRVTEITLGKAQTFHHFKDNGPHPLDGISALIAISAGESFLKRMQGSGIDALLTAETDPHKAVQDYLGEQLSPPKPRPIGELICRLRDSFSGH
jgi:predicted Fe-Mo cluster-binding NifX family protein